MSSPSLPLRKHKPDDLEEELSAKRIKVSPLESDVDSIEDYRRITISVGKNKSLYVWDPSDVVFMQRRCRIIGCASGCFAKTPLQDIFQSIPVRITSNEAAYLRDNNLARFVDESVLVECPSLADQMVFRASREKQYLEQGDLFHERRAERIDAKKEHIISGKLAKMRSAASSCETDAGDVIVPDDKDKLWEIVREDLLARPLVREGTARIQLPTRSWKIEMGLVDMPEVQFVYPETHEEKINFAAYSALMNAGFWMTSGLKYGGDFLLYEGDVHVNHSTCIVKIMEDEAETSLEEVLRIGRVATSCHKAVLWVNVRPDFSVDFTCSKWALMK